MAVDKPHSAPTHPDRALDCEAAIEEAIHDVMDAALAAGWGEAEIAAAVRRLAWAWLRSEEEKCATGRAIEEAKARNAKKAPSARGDRGDWKR